MTILMKDTETKLDSLVEELKITKQVMSKNGLVIETGITTLIEFQLTIVKHAYNLECATSAFIREFMAPVLAKFVVIKD